jgi:hypothetical protein
MLYSEIIAVCSQIHTKHINTLCGQNVEFFIVKPGGTYRNRQSLEGYCRPLTWRKKADHNVPNKLPIRLGSPQPVECSDARPLRTTDLLHLTTSHHSTANSSTGIAYFAQDRQRYRIEDLFLLRPTVTGVVFRSALYDAMGEYRSNRE